MSQSNRSLDDIVSELELRVAYHERLNQDLSDQVYALHQEVAQLKAIIKEHLTRSTSNSEGSLAIGPAHDKPPHY